MKKAYDIKKDDLNLREIIRVPEVSRGEYFDHLRKVYPLRRELKNYTIRLHKKEQRLESILKAFRFKVEYL
jgi:hypothetical protein